MTVKVAIGSQYPVGALARQQFEQAMDHVRRGDYARARELAAHMLTSDARVIERRIEQHRAANQQSR